MKRRYRVSAGAACRVGDAAGAGDATHDTATRAKRALCPGLIQPPARRPPTAIRLLYFKHSITLADIKGFPRSTYYTSFLRFVVF